MKSKEISFSEIQRFRQKWLWLLIGIIALVVLYGVYQQVILKKPFGNHPVSDGTLIFITLIPLILVSFFLFSLKLKTKIDPDGISIQFSPLQFRARVFSWSEIDEAYIREYSPVGEYGGWGIKSNLSGSMAYNVYGRTGLQLVLNDGKKVLIGTQKPAEINDVLDRIRKFQNEHNFRVQEK